MDALLGVHQLNGAVIEYTRANIHTRTHKQPSHRTGFRRANSKANSTIHTQLTDDEVPLNRKAEIVFYVQYVIAQSPTN